jgi:hypothetical protein
MHFLRISNLTLLFEMPLYTEVPESCDSLTKMPLVRETDSGKKRGLAIGSLGVRAARPAGIPANRRRSRLRNRWERSRGSPSVDSRSKLGSGLPWRWRAAVAGSAGLGRLMPGEARWAAGQHTRL